MNPVKIRKRYQDEEENPPFAFHSGWPYLNIGFGDERDYFIENMSLLIASGLGITASLAAIKPGLKKKRMIEIVSTLEEMVAAGFPLWKAFDRTKFFPARVLSIIKSGEESGRLPEHLNLVSIQQHKERVFASRIKSALLYPGIILLIAIVVGIGSAWYTLPKLTSALAESSTSLPLTTRWIIWIGDFFAHEGLWAVPLITIIVLGIVYVIFVRRTSKFIGEYIILFLPGVNKLVQGVEVARFGFIFGALLQAGIPITEALDAVREGTSFTIYQDFYSYIREGVVAGNSLEIIFRSYKKSDRFVPLPMQQLIIASEKSGKLSETLIKIGQIFEEKTEAMTKDLATVLEPLVLLVVGVIVGLVALGVLSPIYSLVNQIQ